MRASNRQAKRYIKSSNNNNKNIKDSRNKNSYANYLKVNNESQ